MSWNQKPSESRLEAGEAKGALGEKRGSREGKGGGRAGEPQIIVPKLFYMPECIAACVAVKDSLQKTHLSRGIPF